MKYTALIWLNFLCLLEKEAVMKRIIITELIIGDPAWKEGHQILSMCNI